MGFRNGAYATVWQVNLVNDRVTRCRITISRKRKGTDTYEQDFGGFVSFLGTRAAGKAAKLKERDRIKLSEVEVTTFYDKEKEKEYTNFNCYDFEMADSNGQSSQGRPPARDPSDMSFLEVDSGEIDEEMTPW